MLSIYFEVKIKTNFILFRFSFAIFVTLLAVFGGGWGDQKEEHEQFLILTNKKKILF